MKKNGLLQYLPTLIMGLIFIGILGVIRHTQGTYFFTADMNFEGGLAKEITIFLYKDQTFILGKIIFDWVFIVLFAIAFALVFFIIDMVTGKYKTKAKQFKDYEQKHYDDFVDKIGGELNKVKLFNVEDFRHFRENAKLQECLKKLYQIYLYGENENSNYFLVLRKFQKGSTERTAIEYLVTFTEKERTENLEEIKKFIEEKDAFYEQERIKKEAKAARKNKNK